MNSRQVVRRPGLRAWQAFAVAGALASAGVLLLPVGTARNVVYLLIGAASVAAILVGVRRNRPAAPHAWFLFALGVAAWVAGDAVISWYQFLAQAAPFPSIADALYLAAYPMLAGALVMLERGGRDDHSLTALLDATILTICLGLLTWVFVVAPTWAASAGPLLGRLVGVGYPLGDFVLLTVLIGLGTARGRWNGPTRLLVAAFGLLVVADTLYTLGYFVPVVGELAPTLDVGWLLAYVLFGAAALHPSMGTRRTAAEGPDSTIPRGRLAMLTVGCLAAPGVIIFELVAGRPLSIWPAVLCALPLIVLTFTRIGRMVSQLQRQSARLARLADTDDVTGLANRRGLSDRLEERLAELVAAPRRGGAVLTLVDLERFTAINDTLGYRTGDALLCAVGRRLVEVAGPAAVVARLGGATFAVLEEATCAADDGAPAARLRDALEAPYHLPDLLVVSVEVAVGVLALSPPRPGTAATPTLALDRADVALSAAKTRPGRVARYGAEMATGARLTTHLMAELADALQRDEIVLHYQPQTELATGRVIGVEALARWQHPTRGLLAPDLFIPAAEQTRLIGPFTTYVLDRAVAQGAAWRAQGLPLTIAVNLSARNLLDPGLVDDVRGALARHAYPAASLELEITESSAMIDPRRSMEVLAALAGLGIALSIDDYGTGHSSLAYLRRLPVSILKIDRSFVVDMVRDRASAVIVRSTIELARQLDLTVVAEGAEDDETVLALRDMNCHAVQGYALARPVPPAELPAIVERIHARLPELFDIVPQQVQVPVPTRRRAGVYGPR